MNSTTEKHHEWEQDTCVKCGDKDYLSPDKFCSESKLNHKPPTLLGETKFSLIGIFGALPVNPKEFNDKKKLCTGVKICGVCAEGSKFCTNCGTLTPSVPKSHHKECFNFIELDAYPKSKSNPFGDCPLCQSEDGLSIDSSLEMRESSITCTECAEFTFWDKCSEESLIKFFKSAAITNAPKKGDRVEIVGDSGTITNAPWSNVVDHIGDNGKHFFDEGNGWREGYALDAANLISIKRTGKTETTHYTYSK